MLTVTVTTAIIPVTMARKIPIPIPYPERIKLSLNTPPKAYAQETFKTNTSKAVIAAAQSVYNAIFPFGIYAIGFFFFCLNVRSLTLRKTILTYEVSSGSSTRLVKLPFTIFSFTLITPRTLSYLSKITTS